MSGHRPEDEATDQNETNDDLPTVDLPSWCPACGMHDEDRDQPVVIQWCEKHAAPEHHSGDLETIE